MNFLKKLLDSEYKELCRFEKLAQEIEKLEPEMQSLKDEDFKDKTLEFKRKAFPCSNTRRLSNPLWKYR